ncbi:hypothetical protein [Breoghania sp.]|uniref:hypothetical protein n=1 Tax=Breoghania sp. TaxID=2065378 RepID=UPI002604FD28|nr:hypothetical protein [Breoghania sp.]MDJ0933563.1 hypothetical protein [Breoghania sp.]
MELTFPVLESDESFGKRLVDNPHGTAQSLLETFLAVSQRLLTGKVFLLIGLRPGGRRNRGKSARVVIVDIRHTRSLIAALNGFEIAPLADALACADIVCTVTGHNGALQGSDFRHLKDGALLFNGRHSPLEIDMTALTETTQKQALSPGLAAHRFTDGRTVFMIADGQIANLAVGRENPNEVMDVTFACQVLALVHASKKPMEPGLHPLPRESEHAVARRYAGALGLDITSLS